jgi:hypothetical protein
VLREHGSPVLPEAEPCYRLCVEQSIDPAFPMAMLATLSDYGTEEGARRCRNWGLMQDAHYPDRATGRDPRRNLAVYASWLTSLNDWLEYIQHRWRTRMYLDVIAAEYAPIASRPGALDRMRGLIEQWEALEC